MTFTDSDLDRLAALLAPRVVDEMDRRLAERQSAQRAERDAARQRMRAAIAERKTDGGAGTELKKLLGKIGITSTPHCKCNARAVLMDRRGVEWCEANLETIVGWLREEADARKLPFAAVAARLLVKRAIRNARTAAARIHPPPAPV